MYYLHDEHKSHVMTHIDGTPGHNFERLKEHINEEMPREVQCELRMLLDVLTGDKNG